MAEPFYHTGLRLALNYIKVLRCNNNRVLVLVCTFSCELYFAVDQGEQSVIFAHADVFTRVYTCAALTNDDAASIDRLTAVNFNAQAFRFRVTAVARGAAAFFVCHLISSLNTGRLVAGLQISR